MDDSPKHSFNAPPERQAIRDKCPLPQEAFVEFSMEDVESFIPVSFEKTVWQYPDYTAIKAWGSDD